MVNEGGQGAFTKKHFDEQRQLFPDVILRFIVSTRIGELISNLQLISG